MVQLELAEVAERLRREQPAITAYRRYLELRPGTEQHEQLRARIELLEGFARARRERELGTRAALSGGFFHRHGGAGAGIRAGTHAAMLGRAAKRRRSGRGARSVTTMGLPIPIIGGLFNPAVMSIVYVFVAVRLFLGFDKTNYSADKKVVMTALWPLLAATNPSFRENLKRATMG